MPAHAVARHACCAALALLMGACAAALPSDRDVPAAPAPRDVLPNDNRVPAGDTAAATLDVVLVAQWAAWRPDLTVDSAVTVMAFGEGGGPPRIPGPLVRTREGTEVRITVRNTLEDSALVVHGLRAGTRDGDTLRVAAGATREVRFTAGEPGTYVYWASAGEDIPIDQRQGRAGQLTGAIVVDGRDAPVDPDERIFVMTVIDIVPDSAAGTTEDIWELAINGLSWPHTERQNVEVGDTVRWRWVNGSYLPHPMHLHGFHFTVVSKGNGARDRRVPGGEVAHVVTEFMPPGSTFAMEWLPTRPGNWLMHCHMAPHITPYPERTDTLREHDVHDIARHALDGMAGLVIGITAMARPGAAPDPPAPQPARSIRMLIQEHGTGAERRFGYIVQHGAEPRRDSVAVPGLPLVLERDETVRITVVNRTSELTTVHWHGIELESIYDGVAGWSGAESSLAPLIARGDSFMVTFTPPRAGTYIHHTHMDESAQLTSGMYAPLLVLEPGTSFDAARDLLFIVGGIPAEEGFVEALNGSADPPDLVLDAGTQYRFRFINILPATAVEASLLAADSTVLEWRPVSKDGATLPASRQRPRRAHVPRIGVGETYDFEWTPMPGTHELVLRIPRNEKKLRQRIVVRE